MFILIRMDGEYLTYLSYGSTTSIFKVWNARKKDILGLRILAFQNLEL